ncbi:MAG: hypothetical protein IPO41_18110 [Acidobacteria bacterium]|nr:hypothetical protein [Acidobacteriota bacterium]
MALLLKMLQARFTHVVVDSPPIASFTDGVLIASMVDGVILVVNAGRSSRQVVKRSRQLLQEIGKGFRCRSQQRQSQRKRQLLLLSELLSPQHHNSSDPE